MRREDFRDETKGSSKSVVTLTECEALCAEGTMDRLELISELGKHWRELLRRYPNSYRGKYDSNSNGWRTLALGLAIAALAEEEYRVESWKEILPNRDLKLHRKRMERNAKP